MAAWGFALVEMPDQGGHDGRVGDDWKGAVVEEDEFYGLFEDFCLFQIPYDDSLRLSIGDFIACALADVAADVDDEDLVGHVDLAFVHVVEHRLGTFSPDFVVAAVAEEIGLAGVKGELKRQFLIMLLKFGTHNALIFKYFCYLCNCWFVMSNALFVTSILG